MNIYILEDDWTQQAHLEKVIHEIERESALPEREIHSYSDGDSLLAALPSPSMENVFLLDLAIGDDPRAGLAVSQKIRATDIWASIIFVTVHDELMPITYHYAAEALDFITKDQDDVKERLATDLARITAKLTHTVPTPMLVLKVAGGYLRISMADIIYANPNPTNSHQSLLHTNNHQVTTVNLTLTQLADKSAHLFRSHRHCLINLDRVQKIDTYNHLVTLAGTDHPQPLSRLNNRQLRQRLEELHGDTPDSLTTTPEPDPIN